MNKVEKLIQEHKLLAQETFYQLNEINKINVEKFSAKEKMEIKTSIIELETEYNCRKDFINDLEDLL